MSRSVNVTHRTMSVEKRNADQREISDCVSESHDEGMLQPLHDLRIIVCFSISPWLNARLHTRAHCVIRVMTHRMFSPNLEKIR
jgi:hypothetical protein